jgi:hypothetical protein
LIKNKKQIIDNIREACKDIKEQMTGIQREQTLEEFIKQFSSQSVDKNRIRK